MEENKPITADEAQVNYVDARTDEERAADAKLQESVVMTTSESIGDPTVITVDTGMKPAEGGLKVVDENTLRLRKIVAPHKIVSREVTEDDVAKVIEDSTLLYDLCLTESEFFNGAFAMSHSQINNTDPLRYFVTRQREIIINPIITRHSNYLKDSKEACMSFLTMRPTLVQRWQKMVVKYQTIMIDPEDDTKFKLSSIIEEDVSGPRSFMFQHEIDHADAKYIYPIITEEVKE